MNWDFHAADRESDVDLNVTGEHPGLTSAAPNVTKSCAGNSSIDGIGNLPWHLGQSKPSVQNRVQARPSIDNGGDIYDFSVWSDDTIFIQEDLPMLVTLFSDRNFSDGDLGHLRDIFETGNEFADGNIAGIEVCGVIRPAKQGGEVIGGGSVGEEDPVQDWISGSSLEDFLDIGTAAGTQAD